MKRKICVVTGTRAEYGLLRWVMEAIQKDPALDLQVIATGMHLSPEFGLTYREIEADGFALNRKIEILTSSDTAVGISKSMGLGLIGFSEAYVELKPDLVLILGDRYEIFSSAAAAMAACIPIAHLHGGEATEGLIDEAIRHSVTKMSHYHFVATETYRQRVIQLGEHPDRVQVVGGLGIDSISRVELMSRVELEASLDFKFGRRNLLVTFHPVTLESGSAATQMQSLLDALDQLQDTNIIFTLPNSDTGGRVVIQMIEAFVQKRPHSKSFSSLGPKRYLSCIAQVDGVVGNSSSGLIEVPSFRKGTINIGDRQGGRLRAESVIDCAPTQTDIAAAFQRLYSPEFQTSLASVRNPYGEPGASEKIVNAVKQVDLTNILKKRFYDLPGSCA
jgi:GDP/UDP-N,N'-diacetylbacillosamine 2-epimerase (hydrolysing)